MTPAGSETGLLRRIIALFEIICDWCPRAAPSRAGTNSGVDRETDGDRKIPWDRSPIGNQITALPAPRSSARPLCATSRVQSNTQRSRRYTPKNCWGDFSVRSTWAGRQDPNRVSFSSRLGSCGGSGVASKLRDKYLPSIASNFLTSVSNLGGNSMETSR